MAPSTASRASTSTISFQGFGPSSRISTSTMVRKIANGSLVPDSTSRVPPRAAAAASPRACIRKNTAAASVEATAAPSSNPSSQLKSNSKDRDRRRDRRRDQDPDRRERAGRRQHAAEGGKPGAQTAVEQDQGQRDRADRVGELHVVEADAAGPGFSGQHADQNEDQQQRGAEAQRHQTRQDAG